MHPIRHCYGHRDIGQTNSPWRSRSMMPGRPGSWASLVQIFRAGHESAVDCLPLVVRSNALDVERASADLAGVSESCRVRVQRAIWRSLRHAAVGWSQGGCVHLAGVLPMPTYSRARAVRAACCSTQVSTHLGARDRCVPPGSQRAQRSCGTERIERCSSTRAHVVGNPERRTVV